MQMKDSHLRILKLFLYIKCHCRYTLYYKITNKEYFINKIYTHVRKFQIIPEINETEANWNESGFDRNWNN